MKRTTGLFLLFFITNAIAQDESGLDLKSVPIAEWLNAGDAEQVPWTVTVRPARLRMDQRVELFYSVRIKAKELNRAGKDHELFLISRVSSLDGEWLNETEIMHHSFDEELPKNVEIVFSARFSAQPGEYLLWIVLYDRKTGNHSLEKRRIKVPEFKNDPLPDLYRRMPLVEFPEVSDEDRSTAYARNELWLPVTNRQPIRVELISMLSPPEHWAGRGRAIRVHNDNTVGALVALSQMDIREGSLSITGLDLTRRRISFEQRDLEHVDWPSLLDALKEAQSPAIPAEALQGSRSNGAFFRDFLNQQLTSDNSEVDPLRVIIVVSSPLLFERGSDLNPIQLEGDCRCRIYHLRFRLNINDVFDQLEKLMKPLRPRTFNVTSPSDLRKALAEITQELSEL